MKSSVYVSAEQIQVIGYKGKKVERVATFPMPEGTMFNGNIMDAPFLTECLASMRQDNPELFKSGVSLVVDGSSILSRRLAVPRLNHRQFLQRVRDDFVESIGNVNDLVCAYRKIGEGAILGCGVNRTQVDSYISTFKAAGIKLSSIHIGAELLLSLVRSSAILQQETIVLNVLDGQTMMSMIFVKGNNILMQRTRLYGDEKEQIFRQVMDNLSTMNQFAQSQKHDEITQSYYLGVNAADLQLLGELNTHEGIKIDTLTLYTGTEGIPVEAHFAVLNMLYGKNGIDLIAARKELDRYVRSKRPKKWWIPVLVVYVGVFAGIAAYLWLEVRDVENRIDEINAYIHNPDTVFTQDELNDFIQATYRIYRVSLQFNARIDWEETMPTASSHMLERILFGHGVDVNVTSFEFNEATGTVRVNAETRDARTFTDYVVALYAMGVAEHVEYTGYGTGADGLFTFGVDIILAVWGDE
jgi:hypothetical protein